MGNDGKKKKKKIGTLMVNNMGNKYLDYILIKPLMFWKKSMYFFFNLVPETLIQELDNNNHGFIF